MSKLIIRITIVITAIYLVACYIIALFGIDIWCQWYYLLFELCVCLCISKQGVYHCKFIKWTAYAILLADTLAYLDVIFDYLSAVAPTITAGSVVATPTNLTDCCNVTNAVALTTSFNVTTA